MDGHIAQLHCRYRVVGAPEAAAPLVSRLDRVARDQLVPAYAAALEQVLPDDEAVYVIRRVDFALDLVIRPGMSEAQIFRLWADAWPQPSYARSWTSGTSCALQTRQTTWPISPPTC